MRPNHVVGRNAPPYRVLVPARPLGAGLHRAAHRPPAGGMPVGGARLVLSISVLVAIPLLALNLRPAVTSVGAVLADIRSASGMSAVLASVVVAAPVWCFAVGGGLAYKLRAAWGTSRTVTLALVMLAATLATRVVAGPYLLLAGTVVACLSIAVLGTLLPVITHAAPTKAWALLTGCYIAAMGGGSGLGALITPQVSGGMTWQVGVSAWALLAAAALVAWRVATRRFTEPAVAAGPRPSPFTLRPPAIAWSTTIHFGLTSGFTFTIMGWLPSILLDHSHVDATMVGWMFGVAMALGVPIALMVPKWARAAQSQSGLAVVLCVPNMLAMGGLLLYPEITPWVWAISLGLGMPAVGLGLTLISLRAAPDGDTAAALSSMVQGFGYAIAGATALGAGLLHSSTSSWEWPLIALLVVLCGQLITGMHAGLPTTVYSGRRFAPSVQRPEPRRVPQVPWHAPLPMSGPGVGWGPAGGVVGGRAPGGSGPRPFPSPWPLGEPVAVTEPVVSGSVSRVLDAGVAEPVGSVSEAAGSVTSVVSAAEVAAVDGPVAVAGVAEAEVAGVAAVAGHVASVDEAAGSVTSVVSAAEVAAADGSVAVAGVAEAEVAESVASVVGHVAAVDEAAGSVTSVVSAAVVATVDESVAVAGSVAESAEVDVAETAAEVNEPVTSATSMSDVVEPVAAVGDSAVGSATEVAEPVALVVGPSEAEVPEPAPPTVDVAETAESAETAASAGTAASGAPLGDGSGEGTTASIGAVGDAGAQHDADARLDNDGVRLLAPRQEALFDVPEQEALFEIPLPRQPLV